MHAAIAHHSNYIVQHAELRDLLAHRYSGWQASSVVLTALAGISIFASLLAAYADPAAVPSMILVMAVLLMSAAGFTFLSYYSKGEVIEARFDASKRIARLQFRGAVAHTERIIPFHKINGARMDVRYNERGQKLSAPILDLANGSQIALPLSTTWADIDAIRAMVVEEVDATAEAWAKKSSNAAKTYRRVR